MTKKANKRVIFKTTASWPLTEEESQNVVIVVSNKKSFFVGFHNNSKGSSNIFKKATF